MDSSQNVLGSKWNNSQVTESILILGKTGGVNKFANSADYVKACFGANTKLGQASTPGTNNLLPDYSKYVKR